MNVNTYEVNPFAIDVVRIIPIVQYGESNGGVLWSRQDITLLQTVLSKVKYSSADAQPIVTQLITSLNAKPTDEGWTMSQINLLDSLLNYVEYAEADGGEYADELIASLKGQLPTYEDADDEEF